MVEDSIIAFGSAVGVIIALAVMCFVLRGKGHRSEIPHTANQ